jgi:hypothetical protein
MTYVYTGGPRRSQVAPGPRVEEREVPIAVAFGAALVTQGLAAQIGPCSGMVACPLVDGEAYHPGRCALEGCPRLPRKMEQ